MGSGIVASGYKPWDIGCGIWALDTRRWAAVSGLPKMTSRCRTPKIDNLKAVLRKPLSQRYYFGATIPGVAFGFQISSLAMTALAVPKTLPDRFFSGNSLDQGTS